MESGENVWTPALSPSAGPKYLQIVHCLSEDVEAGRLSIGDRLPTHRDLAWRLGVTVGTVSRAYAEAERRGLIVGEVGRGSFVRSGTRSVAAVGMPYLAAPGMVELGINEPPAYLGADIHRSMMRELARESRLDELLKYQESRGRWEHRQAARKWVRLRGLDADESRILITSGAEHGISAALAGLTNPGDVLLVDELTWPGTKALAGLFGLKVLGVQGDELGMLPDALERACRTSGAHLAYTIPVAHNPLATTMPDDRRQAIAAVARRCELTILEDDICGPLIRDCPAPLASYAPERTVYITSISKSISSALRTGFCIVPDDRLPRMISAARALNWMAPPLDVEMATRMIESGAAQEVTGMIIDEMIGRHAIMRSAFSNLSYREQRTALHVWLRLPDAWRPEQFVSLARQAGVSLAPTDIFVASNSMSPQGVRVCLGGVKSRELLADALQRLARLISGPPVTELSVA